MAHKRRRLPNGFGQISEIKGRNLRKPFRVMVTTGKDEFGRPICKLLKPESYFKTYNEAYIALMKYNENPYDVTENMTVNDVYEKWMEQRLADGVSESTYRTTKSTWAYCESIKSMRVRDIRVKHIRCCIDTACIKKDGEIKYPSSALKRTIKFLIGQILDYAVEYELTDHNYARDFSLPRAVEKDAEDNMQHHIAFTDEEMELLWKHLYAVPNVDMILIQCYSGWRPSELCTLRLENINLTEGSFKGGMKTKNGKNRIVPIHSKIMPLVQKRFEEASAIGYDFLFNTLYDSKTTSQKGMTRDTYRRYFEIIKQQLNLNPAHRLHDGRVQFVTMAKRYGVDEYAIKRMVGHSIKDITEKIYTERNFEWLKSEIEKIQ